MSGTVKEQWDDYVKRVLVGLPLVSTQYKETRRAFYAGAWAFFSLMTSPRILDTADDDGSAYVEGLRQELLAFQKGVGKEY